MASVSLQLHVLPEEILDWVEDWKRQYKLNIVKVVFFPNYRVAKVDEIGVLRKEIEYNKVPDQIWLGVVPIDLSKHAVNDFEENNSECFVINFPQDTEEGLRQVLLGSSARGVKASNVWKALGKFIKGNCRRGLWVLNPNMRIKAFEKSFPFTQGVETRARKGLRLLPVAGDNVLSLDEPLTEGSKKETQIRRSH